MPRLLKAITFLLLAAFTLASSGDRQPIYQNCVRQCLKGGCTELSIDLKLTLWTCEANCRYECTHKVTKVLVEGGHGVHQFHGKWPFIRMLGLQEPASVLFSVLNGYMHWIGYRKLKRAPSGGGAGAWRSLYMTNALLAMSGWFWSSIFHARDTSFTEKMDYFSAILMITFNAYMSLVKTFNLSNPNNRGYRALLRLLLISFYVIHVSKLTFWPFDYGYNMIAGITVGMISNLSWIYWCTTNRANRGYWWKMVLFVVLLMSAMLLEVLDFPPYLWILDAHALWHAATVPLVYLYYSFFVDDLHYEVTNTGGRTLRSGRSNGKIV
ncbi:Post-GPI attachment to proteins factor 3 [Rhizoclosmatium sp. JEL0117]|nr:Post-GPI attachment to proteins factor 3 [Rhizoclosmatium sp. JEL0117]